MDVIPTHLDASRVLYDGDSFFNVRLRPGEVQAMYWPDDPRSISKKVVEYDVLVGHRSNGTAVTKIYTHVTALDLFGGIADTGTQTYRPDPSGKRKDSKRDSVPGNGSKVLLLCVNGENGNAVILGGLHDMNGEPHSREDGHHLHWRFNGIDVKINKDGEFVLEYQGAQKNDGSLEDSVDEKATGTTITLSKNGNVEIADAVKDGDEVVAKTIILLDHENGKVVLTGQNEIDLVAPKIRHGSTGADEPHVLGNKWKAMMEATFDAIAALTVPTAVGPSGPPINSPQFAQIRARLSEQLSKIAFVE
jgi:hypothetical protein